MNRVVLVGRLARDPNELRRSSTSSTAAINFTIAVDRQSNKQDASADFISCVAFDKRAEFVDTYLKKGMLIGVEGRLQSRSYDGRDGRKVYVTEVVVDNIQILESKNARANAQVEPTTNNAYREDEEIVAPTIDVDPDELPFL